MEVFGLLNLHDRPWQNIVFTTRLGSTWGEGINKIGDGSETDAYL